MKPSASSTNTDERQSAPSLRQQWERGDITDAEAAQIALDQLDAARSDRDATLEEAAVACLELWKSAPNERPEYTQTKISHGCIAAATAIRALKSSPSER